jgi:plastocyanin
MTVRGSHYLLWFALLLSLLLLCAGDTSATEPKKFTLINVVLEGTKIWLPSSVIVHHGD